MIETLTPEQRHQLSRYRQKSRQRWNRILRSTDPINREHATAAIAQIYVHLGLPAPRMLFFPSPTAAGNPIHRKLTRHRWLTRLLRLSTTCLLTICGGSGCLFMVLFFPFLLLYGVLRHLEFLAGFLNLIVIAISLRKERAGDSNRSTESIQLLPDRVTSEPKSSQTSAPSSQHTESGTSEPQGEERHSIVIPKNQRLKRIW